VPQKSALEIDEFGTESETDTIQFLSPISAKSRSNNGFISIHSVVGSEIPDVPLKKRIMDTGVRTPVTKKQRHNLASEVDNVDDEDPLTAPATAERLKRALQERIKNARTPMRSKRSSMLIWSSPMIQHEYLEYGILKEKENQDAEIDDLLL
jgi:hypothetical protein